MFFSFTWFGAYYNQLRATRLIEPWFGQPWIGNKKELIDAEEFARKSEHMNPLDTGTLLLQSEMYVSKAQAQRLYKKEAQKNWNQALGKIRTALRISPASAVIWARLAMVKSQANQFDAELDAAIGHALVRGRWDPEVQYYVFYAGIRGWNALSDRHKDILSDSIPAAYRNAQGSMRAHIARSADEAGWAERLRQLLNEQRKN